MNFFIRFFCIGSLLGCSFLQKTRYIAFEQSSIRQCFSKIELAEIHKAYSGAVETKIVYHLYPFIVSDHDSCLGIYFYESWLKRGQQRPSSRMSYVVLKFANKVEVRIYKKDKKSQDRILAEFIDAYKPLFSKKKIEDIKKVYSISGVDKHSK